MDRYRVSIYATRTPGPNDPQQGVHSMRFLQEYIYMEGGERWIIEGMEIKDRVDSEPRRVRSLCIVSGTRLMSFVC